MIIDVHSHLGDILEHGGGELIDKTGVVMEKIFDPVLINEKGLMRTYGLGTIPYTLTGYWVTRAERARNATATLENMRRSLDEAEVDYTACMPIAPYVTYDDLARAHKKEKRIIPFTTIDFSRMDDMPRKLRDDMTGGARGLKLHPIIQSVRATDSRTLAALQEYEQYKKPVLTHSGISGYYLGSDKKRNTPKYGRIRDIEEMVRAFPGINFIIGHSGLFQVWEVMRRLRDCKNVWFDTSFQSPHKISRLIKTFGAEKVMYASDWPYGFRPPAIRTVKIACRGDHSLEDLLLYKNAAELLGVSA